MQIKTNFLPISLSENIKNITTSANFPWYFNENITPTSHVSLFQFTHTFFRDGQITSDFYYEISPIIYFAEEKLNLKFKKIIRIKANLLTRDDNHHKYLDSTIHQDVEYEGCKSLIYYVDNFDGNTILFDNDKNIMKEIKPKYNSCILFNSNIWHRSTPPINYKKRIVLNCIFEE
jgi:hypothetical protein